MRAVKSAGLSRPALQALPRVRLSSLPDDMEEEGYGLPRALNFASASVAIVAAYLLFPALVSKGFGSRSWCRCYRPRLWN